MSVGRWLWYAFLLWLVAFDFFYNVPHDAEDSEDD